MHKLVSVSLIFFLQIGLAYCLLEQIHPAIVSEEVGHHNSHEPGEAEHHNDESTCCDNVNLIYSNTSRILLEKNVKYQYQGNDLYFSSIVDILTSFQHNLIILANCGPPQKSVCLSKFYLSVFSSHAPPFYIST